MRKLLPLVLASILAAQSLSPLVLAARQDETNASTLRNADVIMMVRAKVPADVIVSKIKNSRCNFDTFPGVLAELKQKGVPDEVLRAMVTAPIGRSAVQQEVADAKPAAQEVVAAPSAPAKIVGGVIIPDRAAYPRGARFFVAPMEEGFDGFISAVMLSKKVPATIVADEAQADFIVVGGTAKGVHKWYDTVFTGYERDRNQGNVRVIRVRDKTVVWAAEAGDRSFWWGPLKKGGRRKVAERLVNKMKSQLFKD
jgi:hypothetical protein